MTHQLPKRMRRQGYGLCDYKGPDFELVKSSIKELFMDDCKATGLDHLLESEAWTFVQQAIDSFVDYSQQNMVRAKTSQQAADLAEKMKHDDKLVVSFIEGVFSEIGKESLINGELTNIVYSPNSCIGYSICSACPYYLKSKLCFYAQRSFSDGSTDLLKIFDDKAELKGSIIILKVLVNLFHYILINEGESLTTLIKYKCLLEDIQLIMGLYKCMNPTGEVIHEQESNLLGILTSERLPIDETLKDNLYNVLDSVIDDIESSNLPYVRDIQKCISTIRAEQSKGFLEDDYYYSMKATSQIREGEGLRKSLLNSVIERDTYKNDPRVLAFDNFTGYQSHYLEETDTINRPIKTIMIQNPGKFKMRGIHISENAIQDRCNYIHRCIKKGLREIKSDCSQKQQEGREFAKLCTLNWFLSDIPDRPGIYCLDFSNATDTMDQEFQTRILRYVMGSAISDYWQMLSESEKTFVFKDKTEVVYKQVAGQPQGLLGSFDAFSLAHHFMMLMVMKMARFEQKNPSMFYRVLGDDSILYSIESEQLLDEDGINVLQLYKDVCLLANFKVNDEKGVYTFASSDKALASFAKVDYMNGLNFSPTPYRLATMYNASTSVKAEYGHLGVAIWRTVTGYPNYEGFLDTCMNNFQDGKWIVNVMRNGYTQSVSDNFVNLNNLTDSQRARINYCISISLIDSTMNSIFMDDKELAFQNPKRTRNSFDDLFKLLPEKELNEVSMDHKIFNILQKNSISDRFLSELLQLEDLDDRCLRICCELIERGFNQDIDQSYFELSQVTQVYRLINRAMINPLVDVSQVFPEASLLLTSTLKEMKMGLMTRGLTKQPTRISYILKEAFKLYQDLDKVLGKLPEDSSYY